MQMKVKQPPAALRAVCCQPLYVREKERPAWHLVPAGSKNRRTASTSKRSRSSLGCEWTDGVMVAGTESGFAPQEHARARGCSRKVQRDQSSLTQLPSKPTSGLPFKTERKTKEELLGVESKLIRTAWDQLKCPLTDGQRCGVCIQIYIVEYYLVMKRNEIMPFAATWMDLEIIILSQVEKEKYHMKYHMI